MRVRRSRKSFHPLGDRVTERAKVRAVARNIVIASISQKAPAGRLLRRPLTSAPTTTCARPTAALLSRSLNRPHLFRRLCRRLCHRRSLHPLLKSILALAAIRHGTTPESSDAPCRLPRVQLGAAVARSFAWRTHRCLRAWRGRQAVRLLIARERKSCLKSGFNFVFSNGDFRQVIEPNGSPFSIKLRTRI
jgi:hypothetical protein